MVFFKGSLWHGFWYFGAYVGVPLFGGTTTYHRIIQQIGDSCKHTEWITSLARAELERSLIEG